MPRKTQRRIRRNAPPLLNDIRDPRHQDVQSGLLPGTHQRIPRFATLVLRIRAATFAARVRRFLLSNLGSQLLILDLTFLAYSFRDASADSRNCLTVTIEIP